MPTSVEMGYPTVISSSTRGLVAPKGTPEPIIRKLQTVLKKAMENPEHASNMDKAGLGVRMMMGDEYVKYIKDVYEKTKKLMDIARKER